MGTAPHVKVIEYLIECSGLDFTITDIARDSRVGRTQTYKIVEELLDKNILVVSRKIGAATLYKVNMRSNITKSLLVLYNNIVFDKERTG